MKARLTGVDNARESVDEKGAIGILGSETFRIGPADWLTRAAVSGPWRHPHPSESGTVGEGDRDPDRPPPRQSMATAFQRAIGKVVS